jgi:MFS family permease
MPASLARGAHRDVSPRTTTRGDGPRRARTTSVGWALAGLSLSVLLSSLGTSAANVALPTLARVFGASFQAVQWVVLAYLLAITTLIVGAARLGDLFGRRRLLLAGIALFTGASIACGLAPVLWVLIAARAAQGLGAAVMMALTMAFVGDTVPKTRIGGAMGLLGTTSAIGTALGPSLGGVLIAGPGWRTLFLVNVPVGVLALLLTHRHLPADRPARTTTRPAFDGAGTLLLAVTSGAYALAMTLGRGRPGALNLALLAGAAVGAALFVRVEARTASPLIQLSMLRDRTLGASLVANALVSTVMMATLVVGPFYLTRALGLGPALVGLALSVGPLVAAAAGMPAGRVADRVGARRSAVVGLSGMALGAALLCALPPALGVAGYVGPIVVVTVGYAFFQTANNTAVMADVSAGQRGVVAAMLSLSRTSGSSPARRSWAPCSRWRRAPPTSRRHRRPPLRPACGSPSASRPPSSSPRSRSPPEAGYAGRAARRSSSRWRGPRQHRHNRHRPRRTAPRRRPPTPIPRRRPGGAHTREGPVRRPMGRGLDGCARGQHGAATQGDAARAGGVAHAESARRRREWRWRSRSAACSASRRRARPGRT